MAKILEHKHLKRSLLNTKDFNGMAIDENGIRIHKHVVLTAAVSSPPTTEQEVKEWLEEMVHAIGMNILDGPHACTSDVPNNEGITGTVIIDTSHIAMHLWNGVSPAIIELDIFSCKNYEVSVPIEFLNRFELQAINFRCIDRTNAFEDLKLYVLYETKNMLNGKTYIGVHSCYNFNYDYLGSGIHLKAAINKYGKENFTHRVVHVYTDEDAAYTKEAEIVTPEFVARDDTYNKVVGGQRPTNKKSNYDFHRNKRWLHNGTQSIIAQNEDVPHLLLQGWQLGKSPSKNNKIKTMPLNDRNKRAKLHKFISPSGELTEIFNLTQFCAENNLSVYGMSDVKNGRQINHKGWTKYFETGNKVKGN